MSKDLELKPENAAIDMLSGYAVDSFFSSNAPIEPWNEECLKNFIDIIVNHNQVFFPLASRNTIIHFEEPVIPNIFKMDQTFVKPLVTTTAEDYSLTGKELSKEFERFINWSRNHDDKIKSWMKYQRSIQNLYTGGVISPKPLVRIFLENKNRLDERKSLKLTKSEFIIAFDIFARTGQYYHIFGDSTPYFCHPFRSHACSLKHQRKIKLGENWSWGRYLVSIMKNNPKKYKDVDWLYEKASIIQKLTKANNASWYQINQKSTDEQKEIILNIASDFRLPAKLNKIYEKQIRDFFDRGKDLSRVIINSPYDTLIKGVFVVLVIGSWMFESWDKTIPGGFGKYRLIRGLIEWPELITSKTHRPIS
jgi:hypothetical protein